MFRLLVTSIMMMLSCVPSQLSNLNRWGGSASVQGQDYNYCEATDSAHKKASSYSPIGIVKAD